MDNPNPEHKTVIAIGKLTKAVWALVIVTALNLLWNALYPTLIRPHLLPVAESFTWQHADEQKYNDFDQWPLQKQINTASVIALAKFQKQGDRYKCVISEILKRTPNTDFYYKVGDEFQFPGGNAGPQTQYGDGEVIFFTGSPATFRLSTTYNGDRISALGDIPLDRLRQLAKEPTQ
jgi:hypothetical protein